jgi:hypothetical protein
MGHLVVGKVWQVLHHIASPDETATVARILTILPLYHRSLALHLELVEKLLTFEESRNAIDQRAQQPCFEDEGWNSA